MVSAPNCFDCTALSFVDNCRVQGAVQEPRGAPPELVTNSSAEILKYAQYHYCPSRDVVSRQEYIPERQFKVCLKDSCSVACSIIGF